jgi:6-phosphogluconolactonase
MRTVARIAVMLVLMATFVQSASAALPPVAEPAKKWRVYIGTYTGKKSQGIYRLELDLEKGTLSQPTLAAESVNPSFLAIHPSRKFLYAVNEIGNFEGKRAGAVSAFAIDQATGDLKLLNQESSGGDGPCHLVVDPSGRNVLVANYGGGSVGVLPIEQNGRLKPMSSFIQHTGSGADPRRQERPHGHSINLDAANRFAMAADLGLDKVLVYRFDANKGTLTPNDPPAASVAPGSGPRHFAFHPDGRHAYVINEMTLTVTAFDYNAEKGVLIEIQTTSTLPAGTTGRGLSTAEVQVHPSGKFLYGSNRGHDTIAIFQIDPASGKLTAAGHQGSGIKTPRNFGIDPTGRFMIVGNQSGDSLVLFRINQETGELTPTGSPIEVGAPVCVKFVSLNN